LIEIGYEGNIFTYPRKCHVVYYIHVRLDRRLSKELCRVLFPEASVLHLPRFNSDSHLLLKMWTPTPPSYKRPFHFQAAWLTLEEFPRVVSEVFATGSFPDSIVETLIVLIVQA
jgi:hypothetical protein